MTGSEEYDRVYMKMKTLKKRVWTWHGEAMMENNDRKRRTCETAIDRIDRGIREVKRHAAVIDEAEQNGNSVRADIHRGLMEEAHDAVTDEVQKILEPFGLEVHEKAAKPKRGKSADKKHIRSKVCGDCKQKRKDNELEKAGFEINRKGHHKDNKPDMEPKELNPAPTQQPPQGQPRMMMPYPYAMPPPGMPIMLPPGVRPPGMIPLTQMPSQQQAAPSGPQLTPAQEVKAAVAEQPPIEGFTQNQKQPPNALVQPSPAGQTTTTASTSVPSVQQQ